jgi:NAD(P)H-hydrate epimerase
VVVCCGKGNNGGDGLVIARHLDNAGHRVHVLLFGRPDELSPDSAVNHRALQGSGVTVDVLAGESLDRERVRVELATSEWVVDALFGTGLRGPLKSPFDVLVEQINDSPAKVLAVDIPSGLDGDTGQPLGPTVIAKHTATLLALKKGLVEPASKPWVGQLHLIDIGLPH